MSDKEPRKGFKWGSNKQIRILEISPAEVQDD